MDPGQIAVVGHQVWRIDRATIDGRSDRLLIRRWTGAAWAAVSSPHPGIGNRLGPYISASSPRNVWVEVLNVRRETATQLHWNGRAWSRFAVPTGILVTAWGVTAVGKAGVWVDGDYGLWLNGTWHFDSFPQCPGCSTTGVPGTSTALAGGGGQGTGRHTYGVMVQAGPLP